METDRINLYDARWFPEHQKFCACSCPERDGKFNNWRDASREAKRLNAQSKPESKPATQPVDYPEITSGLGIGGAGSDDYNLTTEAEQFTPQFSKHKSRGQLWQPCAKRGCDNEPVCLDCEYCDAHCHCGE